MQIFAVNSSYLMALILPTSTFQIISPSLLKIKFCQSSIRFRVSQLFSSATGSLFPIEKYLSDEKKIIDRELSAAIVPGFNNKKLCESMVYSLMSKGKRMCPIICIATCELFGGNKNLAMPTAISLEMIHAMSLIHDDLPSMDNADVRRGMPANHKVYGEAVAILAGDALLSKSFEFIAKHSNGIPAQTVIDIILKIGELCNEGGIAGGQAMELALQGRDDITIEQLQWIHQRKTGSLIKAACVSGAIIACAKTEDLAAMEKFSDYIGLAFQIADDILDCTQTTQQLGKTARKDAADLKVTYVNLMGIDGATSEAQRLVELALNVLEPYGAKADALRAIAQFVLHRKR